MQAHSEAFSLLLGQTFFALLSYDELLAERLQILESERSCMCIRDVDFVSFDDFSIAVWSCSDSVVFFPFILLIAAFKKNVLHKK